MEEGVTIAKVPDWILLQLEMMRHLIKEHERVGRILNKEATATLLRGLDSKSVRRSDAERQFASSGVRLAIQNKRCLTSLLGCCAPKVFVWEIASVSRLASNFHFRGKSLTVR